MPKTVTATEAKTHFAAMLDWVASEKDAIIVTRYGQPKAVIVAYDEFLRFSKFRENVQRQQA